jgi:hypothetical protein
MRLVLGLLTRFTWWFAFVGLAAVAGLGVVPRLAPPPVGGVPHDVHNVYDLLGNYAALLAVYACAAAGAVHVDSP